MQRRDQLAFKTVQMTRRSERHRIPASKQPRGVTWKQDVLSRAKGRPGSSSRRNALVTKCFSGAEEERGLPREAVGWVR